MHDRDPARGPPPGAGPRRPPGRPAGRPPAGPAYTGHRRRRLFAALAVPHLPQDADVACANLVAHGLDRRLTGLAARLGATYTRHADDLVLSGGRSPGGPMP